MRATSAAIAPCYLLERDALDALFGAIRRRGFRLVGPVLRDGAICYNDIESAADLPAGWTDEQDGGSYRLRRRGDDALFGYDVGPHAWKKYLFPPFVTGLRPGDWVSLRWDCVCDRLSQPQLLALRRFTDRHLRLAMVPRGRCHRVRPYVHDLPDKCLDVRPTGNSACQAY